MNIDKYVVRELKKIAGHLNSRKIDDTMTIQIPKVVYHIIKPFLSERLYKQVITEYSDVLGGSDTDGLGNEMNSISLMVGDFYIVKSYDYNRPLLAKYIDYLNYEKQSPISFEEYLNNSIAQDCLNRITFDYAVDDETLQPEFFISSTASLLLYTLYKEQKADFKKTVKVYSQMRGHDLDIDKLKEMIKPDIDKLRIIAKYNKEIELFEYDYIYKSALNTYHLRVTADEDGKNYISQYNLPTISVITTSNESPLTYDEIQLTDDGLKLIEMKYYDEKEYYELDIGFLYGVVMMTKQEFREHLKSNGYFE